MPQLPAHTPALVTGPDGLQLRDLPTADLGDGDVVVEVHWSGVNFKDALAASPTGRVARIDPLVPGIDLAGTVLDTGRSELRVGQSVLVHGYDLGVAHHGGYAGLARVPAGWVVPLPEGLDERQAMALGTAGFTAALSVLALEQHGLTTGSGPVLVTGATGGVGSVAVALLAGRGHQVTAVTGKPGAADWLRSLGAHEVVGREVVTGSGTPLRPETWAGAVDPVGGETLAGVLASLRYGAAVAASGNTGGVALATTVFPFILRGVALLGVDSVQVTRERRAAVWERLATDLSTPAMHLVATGEVDLAGVPAALQRISDGGARGRTVVRVA
ncbi:acryloyl-CoA reductase [Geodermatophilaceae bacterium NBWT11]|nr:acryloyl-CoA reductase [Geodermatophilaceae bacterium NBWT11]